MEQWLFIETLFPMLISLSEFLASNFIKNTGLHLGYPVNLISDSLTTKMHAALLNVPCPLNKNQFPVPP